MKSLIIIIIAFGSIISCKESSTREMSSNEDKIVKPVEVLQIETDSSENEEYELNYVVSVAEGYDYDSLREIALEASELLKFRFDSLDRYFNRTRKKIVLPDNYDDEIWAGDYYFRRFADSIVSIEMRSAYIDISTNDNENAKIKFYSDTLKMFVFANMYANKKQADSLLRILKPQFEQTTIIPTEIYMGCMH